MLLANVGFTKDSAEAELEVAQAEKPYVDMAIAFGRSLITNPDLVERFENGWELSPDAEYLALWHDNTEKGYTDFPKYKNFNQPETSLAATSEEKCCSIS